ncbi:MAG TPA: peptidyl-prolyl cis-trans isomerase, partial [Blastocatellia bacterium]|nr:peptidyl-prolyl cis-trans isomerase [Blastocatellia bacterium]
MTRSRQAIAALAAFSMLFPASASAGQKLTRRCEFVARVNDDVISDDDYEQELKDFRSDHNERWRMGDKTYAEVETEFESGKPAILESMIEELLLNQRARHLGLEQEPEVKEMFARERRAWDDREFQKLGIQISARGRESRLRVLLGRAVIERDVLAPLVRNTTDRDRMDYYTRHSEKFTVPATVTLSQVFIPLAGHTEAEAANRATEVLSDLRAGKSFIEAVGLYTPRTSPVYSRDGLLGTIAVRDLNQSIARAVERLAVGELTEPVLLNEGYGIFRLDGRTPAALR